MQAHHLYIGLGSNLGDRRALILEALRLIDLTVGHVQAVSSLIETQPWGFQSPHPFLNGAVRVVTALTPQQCLRQTQHIERMLGRSHKSVGGQYHDRPIDLDLLLYDHLTLRTPELTLPHPLIEQRDFVRIPLQQVLIDSPSLCF